MSTVAWKAGQGPRGAVPGAGGRLLRSVLRRRGTTHTPALAAVLWDMDGLLIDSEPLWTVAEVALAESLGRTWDDRIKAACIGLRLDASVPLMLSGLGAPDSAAEIASAGDFLLTRMAELFAAHLPVLPGARELLAECAAAGVPCALVSSSYRILVDACLTGLAAAAPGEAAGSGSAGRPFAVSIAGDEVDEAKPSPKPYLLAAAALGVDPTSCVVLEDSVTGATAGVAAGCATVLVPGATVPPPTEDRGWTRAASLAELSLAELRLRLDPAGR